MSSLTPNRLIGVRAKIERAKKHIRDLDTQWQAFRAADPYGIRVDLDPQTGERVYKIEVRQEIPIGFALIIGDAVHSLRSSLDHLAWQLVEANGQKPTNRTAYPIRETPQKYQAVNPAIVNGIAPAPLQLIEATQPYQAGYGDIGRLHELDNFDKHRLLIVAAFGLTIAMIGFGTAPGRRFGLISSFRFTYSNPNLSAHGQKQSSRVSILEDGKEFARGSPPNPLEVNPDIELAYEIAFVQPQIVHSEPVLPFLTQSTQLIEGIVNQFVPFL